VTLIARWVTLRARWVCFRVQGLHRATERGVDFFQTLQVRERESGPGGLTRELETPSPSNSPHDQMILRVDLVDSHGRWKRPCLQTAPECDRCRHNTVNFRPYFAKAGWGFNTPA
jgi:hypothetical protein